TVLSTALGVAVVEQFAELTRTELGRIDAAGSPSSIRRELRWYAAYQLPAGGRGRGFLLPAAGGRGGLGGREGGPPPGGGGRAGHDGRRPAGGGVASDRLACAQRAQERERTDPAQGTGGDRRAGLPARPGGPGPGHGHVQGDRGGGPELVAVRPGVDADRVRG